MCKIRYVKGVLDRFADLDQAVLLVEELDKEFVLKVSDFPAGSKPGMWFDIELINNEVETLVINKEKTNKEFQRSADLMEKLRERSKGSKFRRK